LEDTGRARHRDDDVERVPSSRSRSRSRSGVARHRDDVERDATRL
jgi:hypothetical protein